jgi:repressor LexA
MIESNTLFRPATGPQQAVLDFIDVFRDEHNYSPSLTEIARHLHRSLTTVVQHIHALERKGYVTRDEGVARSIRTIP